MGKTPKKALTKEQRAIRAKKRLENYNPIMSARNALRREFSRSPVVISLMKDPATSRLIPQYNKDGSRSKIDAREHLCNICKEWKRSSKGKKVTIDHIEPVVHTTEGFVDLNIYFARMWVSKDQLQKVCGDCHQTKTNKEWFQRRLKEEKEIVDQASKETDPIKAKKMLKRFTPKKWKTGAYPRWFVERVENLKIELKGAK